MAELTDNLFNRSLSRAGPKFKVWTSAGLLLTYKCNASCEFCYYNCGPEQNELMDVATAVKSWRGLRELAGNTTKIHITGGEPFLYWQRLVEILQAAQKENLGPCDLVETNGFWASDDAIVSDRLQTLDELGVRRLKVSIDLFHQEYVALAPAGRLANMAKQMWGDDCVLVRWEKYLAEPVKMKGLCEEEKQQRYIEAMADYPCRFTGRAAKELAPLVASGTVEQIAMQNCSRDFLGAKGVHIDPYGNVFSGTCSGIIIGNVEKAGLAEIWAKWRPDNGEVVRILFERGPAGLLDEAKRLGYKPAKLYAGKCHLCTRVRNFLLDNGRYLDTIGPVECY